MSIEDTDTRERRKLLYEMRELRSFRPRRGAKLPGITAGAKTPAAFPM